jgi:hypothetical protein
LADVPLLLKASHEVEALQMPDEAQQISFVISDVGSYSVLRRTLLITGLYLFIWLLCLMLYPHFKWVRASVIWNPRIRKIFFLFNPLLTAIPPLRRSMFRPFAEDLRRDARPSVTEAVYYSDVEVIEDGNLASLSSALPSIRGRVVLQGKSGLGKTTYLRRIAKESKDPIVYLEARACDQGVLPAIQKLLPGWLKDEEFLGALVFHGGLTVIIDGYNEAGQSARNSIMAFLIQSAGGDVAVGTQSLGVSWPRRARILDIQPLVPTRAEKFLELQGIPEDQAKNFIETALAIHNESDREASRLVLSNPFDLAVIADMLKRGLTPNLLTLPEQQYWSMAEKFKQRENYEFPLESFSDRVYQLTVDDQKAINPSGFSRELSVMAEDKMVIDRDGSYTFRHDKVRDYFLVVALNRSDRISNHYGDPRFLSAYLSLALRLPPEQARELREDVEEWALDHDDRLLADELRRALRRRKSEQVLSTWFYAQNPDQNPSQAPKTVENLITQSTSVLTGTQKPAH